MNFLRFLAISLILILFCAPAFATGIQVDFLLSGLRDPDTDEPLTSGKVYSYSAGTVTPKALYTDAALGTPAANPVILSAYGQATVYASGKYKLVIKDADDVTLLTLDNLEYTSVATSFADTSDPFGTSLSQTNLTVASLTANLAADLDADGWSVKDALTFQLRPSTATPSAPVEGMIWYDNNRDKYRGYASGAWVDFH
jgi:hypothetical protein